MEENLEREVVDIVELLSGLVTEGTNEIKVAI